MICQHDVVGTSFIPSSCIHHAIEKVWVTGVCMYVEMHMCTAEMGNVRCDLQGQKATAELSHYAEGMEVDATCQVTGRQILVRIR